jgi:hypothetical protein
MGHVLKVRIYYEDTDCGGVVYYANYLRYFERARTEFLEDKGVDLRKLMEEGVTFVVAEAMSSRSRRGWKRPDPPRSSSVTGCSERRRANISPRPLSGSGAWGGT